MSRKPRLIDANAFKENMERKYGSYARQPQDDIDAQPTVDAVPVVHGHWEMNDRGKLICSKCKIPSAMARQFIGMQYKSKYCPNCGVKMDEDDEQDENV